MFKRGAGDRDASQLTHISVKPQKRKGGKVVMICSVSSKVFVKSMFGVEKKPKKKTSQTRIPTVRFHRSGKKQRLGTFKGMFPSSFPLTYTVASKHSRCFKHSTEAVSGTATVSLDKNPLNLIFTQLGNMSLAKVYKGKHRLAISREVFLKTCLCDVHVKRSCSWTSGDADADLCAFLWHRWGK